MQVETSVKSRLELWIDRTIGGLALVLRSADTCNEIIRTNDSTEKHPGVVFVGYSRRPCCLKPGRLDNSMASSSSKNLVGRHIC